MSPRGSDSAGDGTPARPWRTISHAIAKLEPGDTLLVRGGVYAESVTATVSGTASSPILIQAFPGETVIVDSGPKDSSGRLLYQDVGNQDWEPVSAQIGEYRSKTAGTGRHPRAYLAGIPGYENERVALVSYASAAAFRAVTDRYVDRNTPFYVGPGVYLDPTDRRVHIRLSKTHDLLAAERRYGQVLPDDGDPDPLNDNIDPRRYSVVLSQAGSTLTVSGAYLTFRNLAFHQAAADTIRLSAGAHHVSFEGITAWMGSATVGAGSATVHDIEVSGSRILGDWPYWVFWSDMKDPPLPADYMRGVSVSLDGGTHDWRIHHNLIRGSGQDLVRTNGSEDRIFVHHNRMENCGDDAVELEGAQDVGHVEIYENYIANCLTAVAPGQGTPRMTGPILVYRNVMVLLRNHPVNRAVGINRWNGFGGRRFGREEMMKHNLGANFTARNVHYYHNTMVLDRSKDNGLGMRGIVKDPSNTRLANNVMITVNGAVQGEFHSAPGFVMDGNLYWKMNPQDAHPLLYSHDTVPAFSKATGFELHGLGAVPRRGTDPLLPRFTPRFEDTAAAEWYPVPSSEVWKMSDFIPGPTSPVVGAGIQIPPLPGLGRLPDTRDSRDIGALPAAARPQEYDVFPFVPGGEAAR